MAKGARIITVSGEVLLGTTADKNTVVIANSLARIGIELHRSVVVNNDKQELKKTVISSFNEEDFTVVVGALGPEKSDITREVISEALNLPLEKDNALADEIDEFLKKRGSGAKRSDFMQAYFPKGAVIVKNELGTAHGFYLESPNGHYIFALPGKPTELAVTVDKLERTVIKDAYGVILTKTINMISVTESKIVHGLAELSFGDNCRVAYSGDKGNVGVAVTVETDSTEKAEAIFDEVYTKIAESRLGKYIYGIDDTPESAIIRIMKERKLTLSVAESCTGGLIAKYITDCPGSSDIFPGSIVSYANRIKNEMLGVKSDTIEKHGAVSHQVATQMADGVRHKFSTDYGISVTGIAGPGGGSDEKPVGLVYFALSQRGRTTEVFKRNFSGSREMVRAQSADFILKRLLVNLMGKNDE